MSDRPLSEGPPTTEEVREMIVARFLEAVDVSGKALQRFNDDGRESRLIEAVKAQQAALEEIARLVGWLKGVPIDV